MNKQLNPCAAPARYPGYLQAANPGCSIGFVLPADHVIGWESWMQKFKEEVENKHF